MESLPSPQRPATFLLLQLETQDRSCRLHEAEIITPLRSRSLTTPHLSHLNNEHDWWKLQAVTPTHKGTDKHTTMNNKADIDR